MRLTKLKPLSLGRFSASLFVSLMLLTFAGCYAATGHHSLKSPYKPLEELTPGMILHVSTGTNISEDELMDYLVSSRVVYVGESHSSINHHEVQLKIIKALAQRHPEGLAVGVEMLRKPSQPILDRWIAGEAGDEEFFKTWLKDWGLDLRYYKEIFEYLRDNGIPLIALNVPKKSSHGQKQDEGAEEESLATVSIIDIDDSDPYHRSVVEAVLGDPSHMNMDFEGFYSAQLLWEETMADTVANYLKSEAGSVKKMVVLAGGGHISYGFGIPKRVFRRLPDPYTTVMPVSVDIVKNDKAAEEKGAKLLEVEMPDIPLYFSDFIWATEFRTLKDAAPMLGVYLKAAEGNVTVLRVSENSGAGKGGIEEGDIISEMDGEEIRGIYEIKYLLSGKKNGDTVVVTVLRGGAEIELDIKLIPVKE